MFSLKSNARSNNNSSDRQLKKLRRQDLLELLVEQLGESERLQRELSEAQASVAALTDQVERLKDKLDVKDIQLEHLKDKLNDKDSLLNRLKARLDEKDAVLAELFEGVKTMADAKGAVQHDSVVRLEEIAASYYLRQFAREAGTEEAEEIEEAAETEEVAEETEPEAAESEATDETEPEADDADEAEAAEEESEASSESDEAEPEEAPESAEDDEADDEPKEAAADADDDASTENEANE